MGYCFYLYTPDLIERDSGKFAACEKVFLSGDIRFQTLPTIGRYEDFFQFKCIQEGSETIMLNESACIAADQYSETTFFTDFISKYNCSGMLVRMQ